MDTVVEVDNLEVDYTGHRAIHGLSLAVRRGEIFGFLGPNGSGKSTTIKCILGLLFPRSGKILLHGLSPFNFRSRFRIGFLPEEATYYRFLTPVELLSFYGGLCGVPKVILKKRIDELLTLVGMGSARNKLISHLSKGMTQKISFAQTLINDPDTLILDEPTSGLDPVARIELRRVLKDLKDKGKTIFFSSHELSEVELICDSIAIIKEGRLISSGVIKEVLKDRKESLEQFFIEKIKGY